MEQEICPATSSSCCHDLPPHHDSTPPLQIHAPHRKVQSRERRRPSFCHLSALGLIIVHYYLDVVPAFTFLSTPRRNIERLQNHSPLMDELASFRRPQPIISEDTKLRHVNFNIDAPVDDGDVISSCVSLEDVPSHATSDETETNITRTSVNAPQSSMQQHQHNKLQNQHKSSHQKQQQTKIKPKPRPFNGLSRTHQSLLSKTTHMRRQRFVTGKYPLYVEVKQNPTKKWLGLAESRIYLNGTSIEKSLASYDIFHWLTHTERRELHDEYEFLSVELLAEIHVKNPGYVNILSKRGAGHHFVKSQHNHANGGLLNWKSWKRRSSDDDDVGVDDLLIDEESAEGERLWITGFSLTKSRGEIHTVDVESGEMAKVNDRTAKDIKWPNELGSVPCQVYNQTLDEMVGRDIDGVADTSNREKLEDALLVTDGFLVPGKDKGGLYVVRNPGNAVTEWRVCLTDVRNFQDVAINGEGDWFYHRAIWMDLTGDGRQSILAARAKLSTILTGKNREVEKTQTTSLGKGQLVWLERPMPHSFDAKTGTPLDVDGTVFDPFNARNTPWKLRVLDEGPDVMFNVADLDPTDDTVEVISSQFFSKKLSMHSIRLGPNPKVVFRRVIDDRCGSAFSSILADLDGSKMKEQYNTSPRVVDCGSTVVSLNNGDPFSHLLVTSHECSVGQDLDNTVYGSDVTVGESTAVSSTSDQSKIDGGSLFAYRVPSGKGAWKTQQWKRSVIATGFKVQGQIANMINPGAPGFCYTFFPTLESDGNAGTNSRQWSRPLIGLSGDCAESAYILRPVESPASITGNECNNDDMSTKYSLMCEIKCKSTVGSLAIGYDNFYSEVAEQQSGYAKIYVPCYEQDKVLVFALGNGEGEDVVDDW